MLEDGIDEGQDDSQAYNDVNQGEDFTRIGLRREVAVTNGGEGYHREV